MFKDREGEEKWKELNVILGRSEELLRKYWKLEGMKWLSSALAEQIIKDDPYLDAQTHMDSGPSCFSERGRTPSSWGISSRDSSIPCTRSCGCSYTLDFSGDQHRSLRRPDPEPRLGRSMEFGQFTTWAGATNEKRRWQGGAILSCGSLKWASYAPMDIGTCIILSICRTIRSEVAGGPVDLQRVFLIFLRCNQFTSIDSLEEDSQLENSSGTGSITFFPLCFGPRYSESDPYAWLAFRHWGRLDAILGRLFQLTNPSFEVKSSVMHYHQLRPLMARLGRAWNWHINYFVESFHDQATDVHTISMVIGILISSITWCTSLKNTGKLDYLLRHRWNVPNVVCSILESCIHYDFFHAPLQLSLWNSLFKVTVSWLWFLPFAPTVPIVPPNLIHVLPTWYRWCHQR